MLEAAATDARRHVRLGDLPKVAKALSGAYAMLAAGRSRPDSLYARLDRAGLAAPLADRLLAVLDLAITPAETDRVVVGLDGLDDLWASTRAAYLATLTATVDVPVSVDVVGATDTLGAPLALLAPVDGGVAITGAAPAAGGRAGSPAPPTVPPEVATAAAGATVPAVVITGTFPAAGGGVRGSAPAAAASRFPTSVVVVLAAAFVAGIAAVAWAARQAGPPEG